jgi:uncharacterized protein
VSAQNLPLLQLFTQLRKADLPLGIDEYQLVLCALQAGFGISDRASLKRLCRTLWIKSADEDRLFDYHFERLIPGSTENEHSAQMYESSRISPEVSTDSSAPPPYNPSIHDSPFPASVSESIVNIEDEVQVAQAVLQAASKDSEIPFSRYILSDEYFPVTRRQMKQSWRYLRRPVREGPPVELDIENTVNEVGRKGMLLEPVLVPRRINRAELLLLIDHGGSMVPFHILSQRLIETVLRGGRLGKAHIYYFHNCPMDYLYLDTAQQEHEAIDEIFFARYPQRAGALVFSDAGAARGGSNPERIALTVSFLERLKQQVPYVAWLNPMPHTRWPSTSASKIMQHIPMFDLSRRGLDEAISVLRGHPSYLASTLRHHYHE